MPTSVALARRTEPGLSCGPGVLVGTGVTAAVAISFLLALLPISSVLCIGGFIVTCAALAAVPWSRRDGLVFPEDISDPQLRETYMSILAARSELETALACAPGLGKARRAIEGRCDEAVRACSRVAPVTNRLHAYLAWNEPWMIAREAKDLRARADAARDHTTARSLAQAAAACERQLASCETLMRTRERIQARLELVLTSLRAFTATVVKQQTLEDEELAVAGDSVADHVDGVRDELATLEDALAHEAAA
jgi:hypothetical protein